MQEATTFVHILHTHAPLQLETWHHSMALARRRGKWLLAWRAIRKANTMEPADPVAHYELMSLIQQMQHLWMDVSDIVCQLIEEEWTEDGREGSMQHADVGDLNTHFLQQHADSLPHRHAGQTPTATQRTLIHPDVAVAAVTTPCIDGPFIGRLMHSAHIVTTTEPHRATHTKYHTAGRSGSQWTS